MVYVLKWTISLSCATFNSSSWMSVLSQEEKKEISPTIWACELAALGPKSKEPCLGFPSAVLLNVPALACSAARRHMLGMTQEKRDSTSPEGLWSVGMGSQGEGERVGEGREGVGQGYFLPLS